MFLHVDDADYVEDYRICIRFNNGLSCEVDLSSSLDGPVFEPLRDLDYFRQFSLEGNTVSWPNGADFAPEYLYDLARSQSEAERSGRREPSVTRDVKS
ncbi:MAG: DUF2442 domain-containing protein [Pirellulaceae bacterium]|nr:DUF2442 domain-containing protein [Planctomycetales bacterium]